MNKGRQLINAISAFNDTAVGQLVEIRRGERVIMRLGVSPASGAHPGYSSWKAPTGYEIVSRYDGDVTIKANEGVRVGMKFMT